MSKYLATERSRMKPIYHLVSQPSQAHHKAMDIVEKYAVKTFEAEVKRVVERPELFNQINNLNYENTMIETI